MALTLGNLKNYIKHALGGEPASIITSADVTKQQWVNEAGRFLVSMHDWKFLERAPAQLTLTSGQAYVALPSDFGQLISISCENSIGRPVEMTTFQAIADMRTNAVSAVGMVWAAIVSPTQTAQTSAPPVQRLEIYPTPTATSSNALTIFYRSAWVELTSDTHIANIPVWVESLLVQLVRAFARGYEEDRLEELLEAAATSVIARAAIEYDGAVQQDYGPIEGGAVQTAGPFRQYNASTVPDP